MRMHTSWSPASIVLAMTSLYVVGSSCIPGSYPTPGNGSHSYISSSGNSAELASSMLQLPRLASGSSSVKEIGAPVLPTMTMTVSTTRLNPGSSSVNRMHASSSLLCTITQSFSRQKDGVGCNPHDAAPPNSHKLQSIRAVVSSYGNAHCCAKTAATKMSNSSDGLIFLK